MITRIRTLEQRVDSLFCFLQTGSGEFNVSEACINLKFTAVLTVTNQGYKFDNGDIWFGSDSRLYYKPETNRKIYVIQDNSNLYDMLMQKMMHVYDTLDARNRTFFERKFHQGILRNCALTGSIESDDFTLQDIHLDDIRFNFRQNLAQANPP